MTVGKRLAHPDRQLRTTFLKAEDDLNGGTAGGRVCSTQNPTTGSDEEEDPPCDRLRAPLRSPYPNYVGPSPLESVRVKLLMKSLWETFSANGTEMIVTKAGR